MASEVTDPSDWLGTPVAPLSGLDSALRCQVCKEYMESPMITSCAHTFCSLCIRRCLSTDGRCPFCRAQEQSNKLRKNNAVEEAVTAFRNAREELLRFGREAAEKEKNISENTEIESRRRGHKRNVDQAEMGVNGEGSPRKTRSSKRNSEPKEDKSPPVVVEDSEEEQEEMTDNGLAACPICNKLMPVERVFGHLDTHNQASATPSAQPFGLAQPASSSSQNTVLEALPGLNYSMLNETALRRKVAGLGIPSGGSKAALQRRHEEWVNIWNANRDSKKPRSKRDLLRDLDVWEKSQNKVQPTAATGSIMDKEFDGKAWSASHGGDFNDLIKKARVNAMAKQAEKKQQLDDSNDEPRPTAVHDPGEAMGNIKTTLNPANTERRFDDIDRVEQINRF